MKWELELLKSEFLNEVGKQADTITDKELQDYIMIKASNLRKDGFWKYYNTNEGIKDLIKLLSDEYNGILEGK